MARFVETNDYLGLVELQNTYASVAMVSLLTGAIEVFPLHLGSYGLNERNGQNT